MLQSNDLSRSFTALNQDSTLIVVIEMSQSSWLVAGMVPGIERQPLKKLKPEEDQLVKLIDRWRHEAIQAGHEIERVVVAYEAGRDGFWLARWRLDTELLMRAFLGWLRGEKRHCSMAAIPTIEEEDAKRPNREREKLVGDRTRIVNRMKSTLSRFGIRGFKPTLRKADEKLGELRTAEGKLLPDNTRAELRRDMTRLRVVREQIKEIEQERLRKLETADAAENGPHSMVRLIARVIGVGIETADMLVNEILSRHLRDGKAVARYAGLIRRTGESGKRRREKSLARAGNALVRRGMIQLAWRFLNFQKDSALARWFRVRAADGRRRRRRGMENHAFPW